MVGVSAETYEVIQSTVRSMEELKEKTECELKSILLTSGRVSSKQIPEDLRRLCRSRWIVMNQRCPRPGPCQTPVRVRDTCITRVMRRRWTAVYTPAPVKRPTSWLGGAHVHLVGYPHLIPFFIFFLIFFRGGCTDRESGYERFPVPNPIASPKIIACSVFFSSTP